MTWVKISDDFADQCADLSDPAFRTHVEALVWTMRRETGGHISKREAHKLAETEHIEVALHELVATGWWSAVGEDYRINHHMDLQVEPEVIRRRRELDAARQRRARRRKAGLPEEDEE